MILAIHTVSNIILLTMRTFWTSTTAKHIKLFVRSNVIPHTLVLSRFSYSEYSA